MVFVAAGNVGGHVSVDVIVVAVVGGDEVSVDVAAVVVMLMVRWRCCC